MAKLNFHRSVIELEKLTNDRESFLKSLSQHLSKSYLAVRDPKAKTVIRIQATILDEIRKFLNERGFVELLPPIIGPATDPGIRGAQRVSVNYYGMEYKLMSSAILYKQMMVTALGKIYFVSPNVRLEPLETVYTGRHLTEFFQVDIEWANATYHEVMDLAEDLVLHTVKRTVERHEKDLEMLGRNLPSYSKPFERISYSKALKILEDAGFNVKYGEEIPWKEEVAISAMFSKPFFIYDYPKTARGFYDREDPNRPGILRDFDLIYPEGFGEAISGAEREYEYDKVVARMKATGEDPSKYKWYLDMLKEGISPSAGFGIGVERLTRFICGLRAVWEARPYPKIAGLFSP